MRTIILTRGEDEKRKPVVEKITELMNTDVNNVNLNVLSYDEYSKSGTNHKEINNMIKNRLKLAINYDSKHILIDSSCPGKQMWNSYGNIVEEFGFKILGFNYGDDDLIMNYYINLYKHEPIEKIEEILKDHKLI